MSPARADRAKLRIRLNRRFRPAPSAGPIDVARLFDLVALALVAPFAVVIGGCIACAIWLDSPGPVLFRTTRVGRYGRPFTMLKFRKMRDGETGLPLTLHLDERFTPIGRFLAITKLDELPQLWNVVRGEMRLVGPRPELAEFVVDHHEPYQEILQVLPGITGPAQLTCAAESELLAGHHDPVLRYREELLPRKIGIDIEYVRNRSLARDLRLLAATAVVPLWRIVARGGSSRVLWRYAIPIALVSTVVLGTFVWASIAVS